MTALAPAADVARPGARSLWDVAEPCLAAATSAGPQQAGSRSGLAGLAVIAVAWLRGQPHRPAGHGRDGGRFLPEHEMGSNQDPFGSVSGPSLYLRRFLIASLKFAAKVPKYAVKNE